MKKIKSTKEFFFHFYFIINTLHNCRNHHHLDSNHYLDLWLIVCVLVCVCVIKAIEIFDQFDHNQILLRNNRAFNKIQSKSIENLSFLGNIFGNFTNFTTNKRKMERKSIKDLLTITEFYCVKKNQPNYISKLVKIFQPNENNDNNKMTICILFLIVNWITNKH